MFEGTHAVWTGKTQFIQNSPLLMSVNWSLIKFAKSCIRLRPNLDPLRTCAGKPNYNNPTQNWHLKIYIYILLKWVKDWKVVNWSGVARLKWPPGILKVAAVTVLTSVSPNVLRWLSRQHHGYTFHSTRSKLSPAPSKQIITQPRQSNQQEKNNSSAHNFQNKSRLQNHVLKCVLNRREWVVGG